MTTRRLTATEVAALGSEGRSRVKRNDAHASVRQQIEALDAQIIAAESAVDDLRARRASLLDVYRDLRGEGDARYVGELLPVAPVLP